MIVKLFNVILDTGIFPQQLSKKHKNIELPREAVVKLPEQQTGFVEDNNTCIVGPEQAGILT